LIEQSAPNTYNGLKIRLVVAEKDPSDDFGTPEIIRYPRPLHSKGFGYTDESGRQLVIGCNQWQIVTKFIVL
jgi:hypothetical protein